MVWAMCTCDVALERIKRKFDVDAVLAPPRIAYRETASAAVPASPTSTRSRAAAPDSWRLHHRDRTAAARGRVQWREDKIFPTGARYPTKFRPSVEKGVRQTAGAGAVSGHPIVDVKGQRRLTGRPNRNGRLRTSPSRSRGPWPMRELCRRPTRSCSNPSWTCAWSSPRRAVMGRHGFVQQQARACGRHEPAGDD